MHFFPIQKGIWPGKQYDPNQLPKEKNIYAKIIHDADSLDIIRVRRPYDGNYLDFYKHIVKKNKDALDPMGQLIVDARGIIDIQGDSVFASRRSHATKRRYESENAHSLVISNLESRDPTFSVMRGLYANGRLLPEDQLFELPLSDEANQFMFAEGSSILLPF